MPSRILKKIENQYPRANSTVNNIAKNEAISDSTALMAQQEIELANLLAELGPQKLLEKIKHDCSIFETPLIRMAALGNNVMINWLLEQGHDVNQFNTKLLRFTALRAAISKEQVSTVGFLLAQGADPSIHDVFDLTPMDAAYLTGNLEIIKLINDSLREQQNQHNSQSMAKSITLGIDKSPTDLNDQEIENAGIEEVEHHHHLKQ